MVFVVPQRVPLRRNPSRDVVDRSRVHMKVRYELSSPEGGAQVTATVAPTLNQGRRSPKPS